MTDSKTSSVNNSDSDEPLMMDPEKQSSGDVQKGPMSFLSGALTSGLLGWLCFGLSQRIVEYFTRHTPNYNSAIAQSIASGLKTLVVGMSFLATFTFSFIAFGLTIVFIRSLFGGNLQDGA